MILGFPRRWVVDVLSGFAGAAEEDVVLAPRPSEVDYLATYRSMLHDGTFLAGVGMRVALLFCALSPIWLLGRPRRFASLSGPERSALLDGLLHHRIYMVAELTLLLKLCACMALFRSPTVRARSSYDLEDEPEEVLESGERTKRSLPLVAPELSPAEEGVA